MGTTMEKGSRRRFLWQTASVAAVVVLLAGATAFVPAPLVDLMLAHDLQSKAVVWRDRIVSNLEQGAETFAAETTYPADLAFLDHVGKASDIFRLHLIGREGRIFWSTDAQEVGRVHPKSEQDIALGLGEVSITIDSARAHAVEPVGTTTSADTTMIAEVDAPVPTSQGVARVEMFVDLTEERSVYINRVRGLIGAVAMFAALAGAALLTGVMRSNRSRVAALRRRSDAEHGILADQLRMAREVRLLGELNEWLQSSRSLDELFDMVARFLTHILPDCEGSFYVYSNSRDVLDGCASWNGGHHKDHIHPEECWGLRRGRTYAFGENDIDFTCGHAEPHDGRSYLCIPVLAHGETVGLMHLRAREGKSVEDFKEGRRLAQMCAEQISLAIANVRMRDQLQDQSIRDPLTGLFNRRHLTDSLRRALSARQRTGDPVSILAIDVDHFKRFNDNHGHDAGDMVLRAVGAALSQNCDRDELACRIGGEELMLLLPATGREEAIAKAEAIRAAVAGITVRYGEKTLPRVTISLGVAVAPDHGLLPQDLMRVADDALYKAKAAGRNQVILAELGGTDPDTAAPMDGVIALSDLSPPAAAA